MFRGELITARAHDEPTISVASGEAFDYDSRQFCRVQVSLRGMLPDHRYEVELLTDEDAEPTSYPLLQPTDEHGNVDSGVDIGIPDVPFGYRSPEGGWVRADIEGVTPDTEKPWACPAS